MFNSPSASKHTKQKNSNKIQITKYFPIDFSVFVSKNKTQKYGMLGDDFYDAIENDGEVFSCN
jgi:hypothetical protein